MKKTIIILLFTLSLNAEAQSDSMLVISGGVIKIMKAPKYDTTRIIMLVCDTGYYFNDQSSYAAKLIYDHSATWQFGYYVTERVKTNILTTGTFIDLVTGEWYTKVFSHYLDERKKPIKKSIIIWITKTINK